MYLGLLPIFQRIVYFFNLNYMNHFYILEVNALSVASFSSTFSHCVGCFSFFYGFLFCV